MDFAKELQQEKIRLKIKQPQLCVLLYGVPLRTIQSWLKGDKLPPLYYQKLILFRLQSVQTVEVKEL